MARTFEDDDLQRLKKNTSIEALCRERGIELKKHGSRDLIGKCPFHEDKKPSFVVTPEKNLFHCLGCDAGGSVIDLVMKLDKLEFKEAVAKLLTSTLLRQGFAGQAGLVRPAAEAPRRPRVAPERAARLLEKVIAVYEETFSQAPEGKAYLEKRGITDAGLFTRHRVGYANGRLTEILPKEGAIWEELKTIGVLLENGQERFKDCVVFPVFDPDGGLTTLYGRFTGPEPKRHLFLPDRSTGLWNAAVVKTYSEIILVESVIDALSAMMAGHPNVIAIQGTNGLSEAEIFLMRTYGVQKVTLLLDGDDAGGRASGKLRPRLETAGLLVAVKALPAKDDPNSYLVAHGPEALAKFLTSAAWTPAEMEASPEHPATPGEESDGQPAFIPEGQQNAADSTRAKGETLSAYVPLSGTTADNPVPSGTSSQCEDREAPPPAGSVAENGNVRPGGNPPACEHAPANGLAVSYGMRRYEVRGLEKGPRKLKATIRVEHAGKLHVDTLDFYSARCRRNLAQDLCRVFEEAPETIEADIEKLLRHCESLPDQTPGDGSAARPVESLMTPKERAEAETFGKSEKLFDAILADYEACGLVGERANKLLCYLAMTSRKMDDPLSVLILSSSGAGKTALQDKALAFCPPEDLLKLTSLSGKALFYKEQLSLRHKTLALEEGAGAEEASYAIRNLITARELVIESAIKDPATGKITTMTNKVEGPTSVFITTTDPETDAETRSRFFVTSIDESREQTRKILSFQRLRHTLSGLVDQARTGDVLKRHRNFQRLLKPLKVVNRYASQLTYGDDRLQGRRDQPKYLNLIAAVAFLRQLGKAVKTSRQRRDYIEADREDIRIANDLANEILGTSLDELSAPGRDLLNHLEAMKRQRPKSAAPDDEHAALFLFSRRDIREFTGWANARVHRYLKELLDFEYVVMDGGRNGVACRYRLLWDGQGKDGKRFMLGLKDVDELRNPPAGRDDRGADGEAGE